MASVDIEGDEEASYVSAMVLSGASVLPMVLKASIELNLFDIISSAGPNAFLSSTEIASHLGTHNPNAPVVLDRLLRFLASHSILKCVAVTQDDSQDQQRRYGLDPVCKFLAPNHDGESLAPFLLFFQEKVLMDSWYHLKDAILEGGIPFDRAHGMTAFEYCGRDARFSSVFNQAMAHNTTISIKKMLQIYKGFEGLKDLVDVGGGFGRALQIITCKYPHIRGINFDLPHVVADAPSYNGVEHVGGDMFVSIPRAEAIFMKWILHDWSDDDCLKLLNNCFEALKDSGKVIIVESIMPEAPDDYSASHNSVHWQDIVLLSQFPGGKERTKKEFQALATSAGFSKCEVICPVYNKWVLEFLK